MSDYAGTVYPLPEFYQQELSTSLDDGLERPGDFAPLVIDFAVAHGPVDARVGSTPRQSHDVAGFVLPSWVDHLFGHILIVPSRLDLGNVLSNQTRSIEIANLYTTARDWLSVDTDVAGLLFQNLPFTGSPALPYSIPAFGNYILEMSISAEGPVTIEGTMFFVFDVVSIDVPVTGTRVIIWPFQPMIGIEETLQWKTNILEAYDGTEQRITVRSTPRQRMRMNYIKYDNLERRVRALLFDWLDKVFALPMWFEARRTTVPNTIGSTTIVVDTANADFRVGSLVFIYADDETYEAMEIATVNANDLVLDSALAYDYPAGALVMPATTAHASTNPSTPRQPGGGNAYTMEFVTIDNHDLSDAGDTTEYDSKLLLDDCNLVDSGESDSWERPVIVIDSESGRITQTSRTDRSRFRTMKKWDSPDLAELWRIRRLLHALAGSRVSFFLPSFRSDLILTQDISPGSPTIRIQECGYTTFMKSRRPWADVRIILVDGTTETRRIIDSEVDGDEEVLTLSSAFDPINVIDLDDVVRIEYVNLVRISDDEARIQHRHLGDASITIALVAVKE